MVDVLNFYLDDSGTRRPDHKPGKRAAHGRDWFALGGVLVRQEDEAEARRLHQGFCERWNVTVPLHSSEIRARTGGFLWLNERSREEQAAFYEDLYVMMREAPVLGLACVIDRPGYNHRYQERYGRQSWALCKTAFTVSLERAAKHARGMGYRLRVLPERCNKPEDQALAGYYEDLKATGMPFATDTSGKYRPLTAAEFGETLYELRPKRKSSPMIQLADLYLWPMCMGGYNEGTRPYQRLKADGKLIECVLEADEVPHRGTKYSCFDLVARLPPKDESPGA